MKFIDIFIDIIILEILSIDIYNIELKLVALQQKTCVTFIFGLNIFFIDRLIIPGMMAVHFSVLE